MTNYIDAYLEQFTNGCGCPNCKHSECFSSPNFKYKKYDSNQLQQIAENISHSPTHLCNNLLPAIVDPSIYEDLVIFSDFVNSILSNESDIDSSIFKKAIRNPQLFSMLFLDTEEMSYYNFSIDEDLLISFIDQMQNYSKLFGDCINNLISLVSPIFSSHYIDAPHIMRAAFLITIFLSAFDIINVTAISNFFDGQHKFNDQFYKNMVKYQKLTERHVAFWQNIIKNACKKTTIIKTISHNRSIYGMVDHIQRIANANRLNDFYINSNIFKSEEICSTLDIESEIHSLLLSLPTLLDFPSFITISFKRKIQERVSKLIMEARNQLNFSIPYFVIKVHRNNIVLETMTILKGKTQEQLQKPMKVIFEGEKGDDSGGLTREFFHLISKEIFLPDFGLFDILNDNKFYWFKQKFFETTGFNIVGTLIGLAVHNSVMLPIRFPILLYKKLLNFPLTIFDLYEIKPEVARSLQWCLEGVRKGELNVADLCLHFEVTIDNFGKAETIELIEKGSQTVVTNENLEMYVNSIVDWELNKSVEKQFKAFESGFWNVFQIAKAVKFFEPEEFDIIVSGQTFYNWDELKSNTTYSEGYTAESENIKLFWNVFDEFTQEEKIEFLMFLTGSKRVPINGLRDINLEIQRSNDTSFLPVAHTCSEILQLPDYCDKDLLRKNLLICIENNYEFHLI